MITEYKFKFENNFISGYFCTKTDIRSNNFLIYNTLDILNEDLKDFFFGFDFAITKNDRKQLIKLLKEFIILDIYGDEYSYNCENKKQARECFFAENGKDNFSKILTNNDRLIRLSKNLIKAIDSNIEIIQDDIRPEDTEPIIKQRFIADELEELRSFLK